MDLAPAPNGEGSTLKQPVIEVGTMASAEFEQTTNHNGTMTVEEIEELQRKEGEDEEESDSDVGSDDWESLSLYEDALELVRDEQLRDGGEFSLIYPTKCFFPWTVTDGDLVLWF